MSEENDTHKYTTATDDSLHWLLIRVNELQRTAFTFDQVRDACDDLKINPILLEQAIRTGDMSGEAIKGSLLQTFYDVLEEYVNPLVPKAPSMQPVADMLIDAQMSVSGGGLFSVAEPPTVTEAARIFEAARTHSSQSAEPYPSEQAIREATRILAEAHTHSFTYLLNQGHNALRGCPCGLSFVGLMAGMNPDELRWHRIKEENEE